MTLRDLISLDTRNHRKQDLEVLEPINPLEHERQGVAGFMRQLLFNHFAIIF